ncbi:kinase-like protein [Durotheca rogersii]|uniref:kinase-like protein n=1 Tax=Durotheca rogersii TaxID=419775 RepID=UPI00221EFCF6|nr:kinase-like protein [Durotheca rogersii]KAI5859902.1 kinase-like protein [Durotheca rogersii]
MAPTPNPQTLFHLVPLNHVAEGSLLDNLPFVSTSQQGEPGLEVGYHVPSTPRGYVITSLGRNADLTLSQSSPENPMSRVHVVFEINPDTQLVILSVRSRIPFSVTSVAIGPQEEIHDINQAYGEQITGSTVILWGQNYVISIAAYCFKLLWFTAGTELLKTRAMQDYRESLSLLDDVAPRDQPTDIDTSAAERWHLTRLDETNNAFFDDIEALRVKVGHGAFGTVYKAVDQASGHVFAIKVADLERVGDIDVARATLHREIKAMKGLRHPHIIEYLGQRRFDTPNPEIFMPLRTGSLTSLIKSQPTIKYGPTVLKQMLSAIDYLANKSLVHRDLKPDNILYYNSTDFGLARHPKLATSFCGTGYYQAPELRPGYGDIEATQGTKMDVWSLFATVVAVDSHFKAFPPNSSDYGIILSTLLANGLTTRRSKIPRLLDTPAEAPQGTLLALEPSNTL